MSQPVVTEDDLRDAYALLGEHTKDFYDGLLADNPSSRVREAVRQVLIEAAAEHRAAARKDSRFAHAYAKATRAAGRSITR